MKTRHALTWVAAAALALLYSACASQAEGDRCRSQEDCGTDGNNVQMRCVPTSALAGNVTVCCPVQGAATSEYCRSGIGDLTNPDASGPIDDDGQGEPDADTPDATEEPEETPDADADTPDASEEPEETPDAEATEAGADAEAE